MEFSHDTKNITINKVPIDYKKEDSATPRSKRSTRAFDTIGPKELSMYRISSGLSLHNINLYGRSPTMSSYSNMKNNANTSITNSNIGVQKRIIGFAFNRLSERTTFSGSGSGCDSESKSLHKKSVTNIIHKQNKMITKPVSLLTDTLLQSTLLPNYTHTYSKGETCEDHIDSRYYNSMNQSSHFPTVSTV